MTILFHFILLEYSKSSIQGG